MLPMREHRKKVVLFMGQGKSHVRLDILTGYRALQQGLML